VNDDGAITLDEVRRLRTRRFRIGLGCIVAVVVLGCVPCIGVSGLFVQRGSRIGAFDPPAVLDPASIDDPLWKRVAIARRAAMTQGCADVGPTLIQALAIEPPETQAEVLGALRTRMRALETLDTMAACHAIFAGHCDVPTFAGFRAYIVLRGQADYDAAVADPDSLDRIVAPAPLCPEVADLAALTTPAIVPPMPREAIRDRVPKLCARFACTVGDLFSF